MSASVSVHAFIHKLYENATEDGVDRLSRLKHWLSSAISAALVCSLLIINFKLNKFSLQRKWKNKNVSQSASYNSMHFSFLLLKGSWKFYLIFLFSKILITL